jgi:serine/threonine protein kinase
VTGDPLTLDTRSDVYALGVMLYELLAGELPYTLSKILHEAVQTIQQTDPAPLSSVSRIYRGDIETIVAKALEEDKERRYASEAELAQDIRQYLEDKPIVARPPSTTYQLQKFARRHKALVTSLAIVFLTLAVGIAVSTGKPLWRDGPNCGHKRKGMPRWPRSGVPTQKRRRPRLLTTFYNMISWHRPAHMDRQGRIPSPTST